MGTFANPKGSKNDKTVKFLVIGVVGVLVLCIVIGIVILLPMLSGSDKNGSKPLVFLSQEPEETKVEMVSVLKPIRPIQPAEALTAELFQLESIPKANAPQGMVTSLQQIQGMWVKKLIMPGVPLNYDSITSERPTSSLTLDINEGNRAVTIKVDERTGVEGWARPGALVDVILITDVDREKVAKAIICGAKVLSLGRQTQNQAAMVQASAGGNNNLGPVPSTVTLEVPIAEANKLILAQAAGSLTLTLRNDKDPLSGCLSAETKMINVMTDPNKGPAPETPTGPIVKVKAEDGSVRKYVFTNGGLKQLEEEEE